MDDDSIVESGTHGALLDADGEYAALWRTQADADADVDARPGQPAED